MSGTTDLEVYGGGAIEPVIRPTAAGMVHYGREDIDSWVDVMSDIVRLANTICHTAFVPKAYRDNAPATAAAILAGRELGLPPMTSLRHVQVVEGSPSLGAEYKRARVLAAGHQLDIDEHTTEACQVTGHRRGHKSVTVRFTIQDARRAGLVKDRGAYMTRPRRMLFARASTEVVDALFADLTNGLPTTELLEAADDGDAPLALDAAPAPAGPQRVTAEQARERRPQTVPSTAEAVEDTADAASGDTDPAPAPEAAQTPEDPTTSGASSSAHAPASASPQRTGGPSPSTSNGSGAAPARMTVGSDSPGTVTDPQLKAIWTVLGNVFKVAKDEAGKEEARLKLASIVGRELPTTTVLSFNEAGTILDTLDLWRREAADVAANPREYLDLMTAPQSAQDAGPSGE